MRQCETPLRPSTKRPRSNDPTTTPTIATKKKMLAAPDHGVAVARDADIERLPTVLLGIILAYGDHVMLHDAELSSRVFRSAIQARNVWRIVARRGIVMSDNDEPSGTVTDVYRQWKQLACLSARTCDPERRLLRDVVAFSSIDRPVETPSNTLQPSRCWLSLRALADRAISRLPVGDDDVTRRNLANVAQIQCGCEMGDACYWSSSPSTDKDSRDFIDYNVHEQSLVSHLQIIPYRAFWHPDSPTYAPHRISLTFYSRPSPHREPYDAKVVLYESPVYQLVNEMQLQEFALPAKVWLPSGGIMRLHLLGRYQAETFELPPWLPIAQREANYYSCLSFVNAVGVSAAPRAPCLPRRPRAASFS